MIIPHKDVRTANTSAHVFALREDTFKYSFLTGREPKYEELAQTGDAQKGQYITELTVVAFAQRASVHRSGYQNVL